MTRAVQRCQKVDSGSGLLAPGRRRRSTVARRTKRPARHATPPASTRWPSRLIRAGSRITAATIAMPTTIIAPSAIERRAWLSTIQIPASEMITARPEKNTESPDVDSAASRASLAGRPRRTSSR